MSYQEALKRIKKAKETDAQALDLSYLELKEIPPEVGALTSLTELRLDSNQITEIQHLDALINLTELYLFSNQITEIQHLDALINLTSLRLDRNQITEIQNLDTLVNLTELYLFSNQITKIQHLEALVNLTELSLFSNQILEIQNLDALVNLRKLWLSRNQITKIQHLDALVNLTSLSLGSNQITEIQHLDALANLTSLRLDNNQIREIQHLDALVNLTQLRLDNNQITEIQHLDALVNLTELSLGSNQITEIQHLDALINLTELSLGSNQIKEIHHLDALVSLTELWLDSNQIMEIQHLGALVNLTELCLDSNQITEIQHLDALVNLTSLRLSSNQIEEIQHLEKLVSLTSLRLSSNQITEIKNLEKLVNLKELWLSGNQITEIKNLEKLVNLTSVLLDDNSIEIFPSALLQLKVSILYDKKENHHYSDVIYLGDNPFVQPSVEIIKEGKEAIQNYYEQLETQGPETICEAKIMIVGESGSGKTTLMKKLFDKNYPVPNKKEKSTLGIEVKTDWSFEVESEAKKDAYRGHIWDFGGQQIQYMLHQFFLTTDCVYILMANKRKEFTNFDYWLNVINVMGGKSPLIILFNEINIGAAGGADYVFEQKRYQETFPELQIDDPLRADFSNKKDKRFDVLVDTIQQKLVCLNHVGHVVPANWLRVREAIAKQVEQRHITVDHFFEICETYGVKQESFQRQILRYFHLLGIVLHFENDPNLQDTIFLDPNWTVDAVYSILSNEKIVENKGLFQRKEVDAIWQNKGYKFGDRSKLFRLMLKNNFDLCYELEGKKDHYILPILLPKAQPSYEWEDKDCLQFRYQYKFRPKGIVSRLIVRMDQYIDSDKVWQEGVVLVKGGAQAQVKEAETKEYGNKIIDISVAGDPHFRKEFLTLIREEIEKVQKKAFPHLKYKEMVPCHCTACLESKEKTFFAYDILQKYRAKNIPDIRCEKDLQQVNVLKLLGAVYGPNPSHLRKLIQQGKIKDALEQLLQFKSILSEDMAKEVELQLSRFSKNQRDFNKGMILKEEEDKTQMRLTSALLDLLKEMEGEQGI